MKGMNERMNEEKVLVKNIWVAVLQKTRNKGNIGIINVDRIAQSCKYSITLKTCLEITEAKVLFWKNDQGWYILEKKIFCLSLKVSLLV